jgi:hypothetical protein
MAEQRMRVIIKREIDNGRVPPDGEVARIYGPDAAPYVCQGWPRVDAAKFWAEIDRLEALQPPKYRARRESAAERLGVSVELLDHLTKRGLLRADREAPPYMCWKVDGGKRELATCQLMLGDGTETKRRLNTSDPEVAAARMPLILWHAIRKRLPGRFEHESWRRYGGPIPKWTRDLIEHLTVLPWEQYKQERLSAARRLGYDASTIETIDWLTDQDKTRPVSVYAASTARYRARKDPDIHRPPPIVKSWWPFLKSGGMLKVNRGQVKARLIVYGREFPWWFNELLPHPNVAKHFEENRVAAVGILKPAVEARALAKTTANDWRGCKTEAAAEDAWRRLSDVRALFVEALRKAGAEAGLGDDWAELVRLLLKDPPQHRARTIRPPPTGAMARAVSSFARDMRNPKYRDRPPIEPHRRYLGSKIEKIRGGLTFAAAEKAFKKAQDQTGNYRYSERGRRRAPETT